MKNSALGKFHRCIQINCYPSAWAQLKSTHLQINIGCTYSIAEGWRSTLIGKKVGFTFSTEQISALLLLINPILSQFWLERSGDVSYSHVRN